MWGISIEVCSDWIKVDIEKLVVNLVTWRRSLVDIIGRRSHTNGCFQGCVRYGFVRHGFVQMDL